MSQRNLVINGVGKLGIVGSTGNSATIITGNPPPDIYEHSFEDNTAGDFTGNGGNPVLDYWTIDSSSAAPNGGTRSIIQTVPISAGNYSDALVKYDLPSSPISSFYVRFAIKWGSDWEFNDDHKINRAQNGVTVFGNHGSLLTENGGDFWWFWDDFGGSRTYANVNTPSPNANDLRGSWQWIEIFRDISDTDNLIAKVWINGTLYFDLTFDATNPETTDLYNNQFLGTLNSVVSSSTLSVDHIAYSSTPIGIP